MAFVRWPVYPRKEASIPRAPGQQLSFAAGKVRVVVGYRGDETPTTGNRLIGQLQIQLVDVFSLSFRMPHQGICPVNHWNPLKIKPEMSHRCQRLPFPWPMNNVWLPCYVLFPDARVLEERKRSFGTAPRHGPSHHVSLPHNA
jgi:hypothetical protein